MLVLSFQPVIMNLLYITANRQTVSHAELCQFYLGFSDSIFPSVESWWFSFAVSSSFLMVRFASLFFSCDSVVSNPSAFRTGKAFSL